MLETHSDDRTSWNGKDFFGFKLHLMKFWKLREELKEWKNQDKLF